MAEGDDFASVIKAAGTADMVRAFHLTAVRTGRVGLRRQGIVGATHIAARRRDFRFLNGHNLSFLSLHLFYCRKVSSADKRRVRGTITQIAE